MHAVVIDDSRTRRAILGKMLKDIGCNVPEGGDGHEAWDQPKQFRRFGLDHPGSKIDERSVAFHSVE